MGARNRGGIGLSYRPARLHRLAEFIPWNRFLGTRNVSKYGRVMGVPQVFVLSFCKEMLKNVFFYCFQEKTNKRIGCSIPQTVVRSCSSVCRSRTFLPKYRLSEYTLQVHTVWALGGWVMMETSDTTSRQPNDIGRTSCWEIERK